jgi:hypothetical protein
MMHVVAKLPELTGYTGSIRLRKVKFKGKILCCSTVAFSDCENIGIHPSTRLTHIIYYNKHGLMINHSTFSGRCIY